VVKLMGVTGTLKRVSGCVMVFLSSKVLAAKLVMPAVAQSARENLVSACLHAPKTVQGHPIS
jgi:hypothetical protein